MRGDAGGRRAAWWRTLAWRGLAVIAAITGPGASPARPADMLSPIDQVIVRDVADGPGPSHLIPIGGYLLLVDPWSAEIRRYRVDDLHAPPHVCTYPRAFAPWHTERRAREIRLVGEPYGPGEDDRYVFRSRHTMVIAPAQVATLAPGGACPFPIRGYDARRDLPPVIAWPQGEGPGATAVFPLDRGRRARVSPQGGARAEIYAIRAAGALSGGRTLVWWSEVDAYPLQGGGTPDPPGAGGRVTASQYLGVIGPRGGAPGAVIRLRTAAYPALSSDAEPLSAAILTKPGFDYVAGGTAGGADRLWIVAADMTSPAPRRFVLRSYALDALAPADRATIDLAPPHVVPQDRNDRAGSTPPPIAAAPPAPGAAISRAAWFERARGVIERQIGYRWHVPAGADIRPCGGADRCAVGADASGALGVGPGFPDPVTDKIDRAGGANWMRPRHLVGLPAGSAVRGIPYSIGGEDLDDGFAARLAAGYAPMTAAPPPIGHIREGMEWPKQAGNYPLGIDCSALVAKVFDLAIRSTGDMMRATDRVTPGGVAYKLPRGPAHVCPEPVRHLSEIRKGDVILRDGHIVIYAGTARIGGRPGRSRGLRVLESSSRCGGVCESVYDPTFFDGWWILRIRLDGAGDCPHWLDTAAAAEAQPARASVMR